MSQTREFFFVATICVSHLCAYAGIGQVLPLLDVLGSALGAPSTGSLSWAVAAYCAAPGACLLFASRLGDVFGHRRVLLLGLAWAALWAAVAGASFSLPVPAPAQQQFAQPRQPGTATSAPSALFLVSRALQGLGAALALPAGSALLAGVYPDDGSGSGSGRSRGRAVAFALHAAAAPLGLLAGAAGAAVLALAWWPLAFFATTLTLLATAAVGELLHPGHARRTADDLVAELDVPGAAAGVAALVLLGFALNQAPLVGWTEPYVWLALIAGVLLAVLFVMIESYYAPRPLLPLYALSWHESCVLLAVATGWACFGVWLFYSWQFVLVLRDVSPLLSTAYFVPIAISGTLAAVWSGSIMRRLGSLAMLCVALFSLTLGAVLTATVPVNQIYWAQFFISTLVVGWAMGSINAAATLLITDSAEKKHFGVLSILIGTVTFYGIFIGLGVAGTVETYATGVTSATQDGSQRYRNALWTSVGLGGLGLILCLLLAARSYMRNRHSRALCCNCYGFMQGPHQI
ncbi:major facilitator superfamily-domain-containing protein [Xylariaceae sp. FL0804]|nr:major facilitator superfamily-domain-containing protein [Xylariaceae sp. FL0804]